MTQQVQSNKEANLSKQVAELQGRVKSLEQLLHQGKDVLTLEEAAKFMGIARSSLYKMTHEQTIPFYKPNGKMIFFEKSDLLAWVRKNRVSSETEISEEAERIIQRLATK
jgi:excisionase family DNA binding protein